MNLPSLIELQPYLTALGAVLSVATLGFILNMMKAMSDAAKMKAEVLEAEKQNLQADLQRTEKWNQRKVDELTAEVEGYKQQLKRAGVDLRMVSRGDSDHTLVSEVKVAVQESVAHIQARLGEIEQSLRPPIPIDPSWHLELAKGLAATGNWESAAASFDQYVASDPSNWEAHFARAVAHANSRAGEASNLAALRAYNDAIACAPMTPDLLDQNLRARLFIYRGAMLKRLARLDEAEADLLLAKKLAHQDFEIRDIEYNLACVYAMRGDRANLMDTLAKLRRHENYRKEYAAIRGHLNDYSLFC